ncbi:hypothetical protein BGZ83_010572 [Gryganskiella cystojenkinii]|nr:hypothetical protein BGZ83_010572 [Gryganskiella cystojenkinii]
MSKTESEEIVVASSTLSPGGGSVTNTSTNDENGDIKEAIADEPKVVSEEVLKWREYIKSTERPEVTRRWYLEWSSEDSQAFGSITPIKPLTVRVGVPTQWMVVLDPAEIEASEGSPGAPVVPTGWYSITCCVSLKKLDLDSISKITFQTERLDNEYNILIRPVDHITILRGDRIAALQEWRDNEYALFRFHNEMHLDFDGYLSLDIRAEASVESSLEIHYIEVTPSEYLPPTNENYKILYGQYIPDQVIHLPQPTRKESSEARHIHAYDVSDSGLHMATLSFTKGQACVELWDITPSASLTSSTTSEKQEESSPNLDADTGAIKTPQAITIPAACSYFDFPGVVTESLDAYRTTQLAVSYFGSKIMLFGSQKNKDYVIETNLFRCRPRAPKDHNDLAKPWHLERTTDICDERDELQEIYGCGVFVVLDRKSPDEKEERFIFSDSLSVSIYDTSTERWSLMHRISFTTERHLYNAESVAYSSQGRFIAWTGQKGIVSVWDIETGKAISHIGVDEDTSEVQACISSDGSMVLVSSAGFITLYQTMTGIKLGIYKEGLALGNFQEMAFGQRYFGIQNRDLSTEEDENQGRANCVSVVSTANMQILKNVYLDPMYEFLQKGLHHNPVMAYGQGSVMNILRAGDKFVPTNEDDCPEDCPMEVCADALLYPTFVAEHESDDGEKFDLSCSPIRSRGSFIMLLKVSTTSSEGTINSITIPIGSYTALYRYFFHGPTGKLFLMCGLYVHVWQLSAEDEKVGTLESIRKIIDDTDRENFLCESKFAYPNSCVHGRRMTVDVQDLVWYDLNTNASIQPPKKPSALLLTLPKNEDDDMPYTEEERVQLGLRGLIALYLDGDVSCRSAIVEFLKPQIRPVSTNETSCIIELLNLWTPQTREFFELILVELLRQDRITWIPNIQDAPDQDPLRIMLSKAQTQPSAKLATELIIDYCVTHAIQSRNLAFLAPVYANMKHIMELYPENAIRQLARVAYLPVPQREYILNNHIVQLPPASKLQFWRKSQKPLSKMSDPIMQLHFSESKEEPKNDAFTREVFMASFDALWYYKDRTEATMAESTSSTVADLKRQRPQASMPRLPRLHSSEKGGGSVAGYSGLDSIGEESENGVGEETAAVVVEEPVKETNGLKALYYMLEGMFHLQKPAHVECYDFNLEYFDNPAIAALVAYKWNTIGFNYWMVRFVGQCIFYALVVIAALLQVYYHEPSQLLGLFIAIIVMSSTFVWLEFLQALHNFVRYEHSLYNVLDVIAFSLPLAGSIVQVYNIHYKLPQSHNIQLISFSVLAVAIHLLFELRINKSVCKYVTIIQQAIVEIRVFFIIFACGIFAFAISGGKYDAVSSEFAETTNVGFQIMMIVFFFFTVILMMNVLISLVNVAFDKGGDSWRLVWIESRLRYIESAENMSYRIPGFRQTYNCFPNVIYYTATDKQVRDYQEKYDTSSAAETRPCETDPEIFTGWGRDTGEDQREIEEERKSAGVEETAAAAVQKSKAEQEADADDEAAEWGEGEGDDSAEGEGKGDAEGGEGGSSKGEKKILEEEKKVEAEIEAQEVENKSMIVELKSEVLQLKRQLTEQQRLAHSQFIELKELLLLQQATRPGTILGE